MKLLCLFGHKWVHGEKFYIKASKTKFDSICQRCGKQKYLEINDIRNCNEAKYRKYKSEFVP